MYGNTPNKLIKQSFSAPQPILATEPPNWAKELINEMKSINKDMN
jgi:hypothetical protein